MRTLSDREIQNILRLKLNAPINPINFRVLGFNGLTNGSNLTRLYNADDLKNNYVRLISMHVAIFAAATMMRENAQDNKIFTENTNSRYSMIRSNVRIDHSYLEQMSSLNKITISIDGNSLNIFSNSYEFFQSDINLNILNQSTISEGIDLSYRMTFITDMVANTNAFLNITALMYVELLNDINPFQITQEIKD